MIRQNIIETNNVKVQRKAIDNQKVNKTIFQKDKSTQQNTLEPHGFKNIKKKNVQSKKVFIIITHRLIYLQSKNPKTMNLKETL